MKFLFVCMLILSLSGCTRIQDLMSDKEEIEVVSQVEEKIKNKNFNCFRDDETVLLKTAEDRVNTYEQTFYMDLKDLAIPEGLKDEEIQDLIDDAVNEMYKEFLGVQVQGVHEKERVKIIVEINFEVADIDALVEEGLLDKGEIESQYVSLKKTKKELESQGYVCEVVE